MLNLINKFISPDYKICSYDFFHPLKEICERVHSSCDDECPVYAINGGTPHHEGSKQGCVCFKNGEAMFNFIKIKREGK